jgi:hypothetical protein
MCVYAAYAPRQDAADIARAAETKAGAANSRSIIADLADRTARGKLKDSTIGLEPEAIQDIRATTAAGHRAITTQAELGVATKVLDEMEPSEKARLLDEIRIAQGELDNAVAWSAAEDKVLRAQDAAASNKKRPTTAARVRKLNQARADQKKAMAKIAALEAKARAAGPEFLAEFEPDLKYARQAKLVSDLRALFSSLTETLQQGLARNPEFAGEISAAVATKGAKDQASAASKLATREAALSQEGLRAKGALVFQHPEDFAVKAPEAMAAMKGIIAILGGTAEAVTKVEDIIIRSINRTSMIHALNPRVVGRVAKDFRRALQAQGVASEIVAATDAFKASEFAGLSATGQMAIKKLSLKGGLDTRVAMFLERTIQNLIVGQVQPSVVGGGAGASARSAEVRPIIQLPDGTVFDVGDALMRAMEALEEDGKVSAAQLMSESASAAFRNLNNQHFKLVGFNLKWPNWARWVALPITIMIAFFIGYLLARIFGTFARSLIGEDNADLIMLVAPAVGGYWGVVSGAKMAPFQHLMVSKILTGFFFVGCAAMVSLAFSNVSEGYISSGLWLGPLMISAGATFGMMHIRTLTNQSDQALASRSIR